MTKHICDLCGSEIVSGRYLLSLDSHEDTKPVEYYEFCSYCGSHIKTIFESKELLRELVLLNHKQSSET